MRAYYFDNIPGDQRLPHDYSPSRPVDQAKLKALGVDSWAIPVQGHEPHIDAIAQDRGYKNRDFVNVSKAGMGDVSGITA
jgi:1,2-dihydroxy-3-keto-5-methylthiopentene dioxygenase